MAKDVSFATALATFSKAASTAFEQASNQTREAKEAATLSIQEIQREHEAECAQWKDHLMLAREELNASNRELRAAEATNANYSETIAALRLQLKQTETQSKNWQDHFIRSEQERCRLAEKFEQPESNPAISTRRKGLPPITTNNILPRASTSALPPSSAFPPSDRATPRADPIRAKNAAMKASQTPNSRPESQPRASLSHPPPAPVVLRRVQALIQLPVKEESESDEDMPLPAASRSPVKAFRISGINGTKSRGSMGRTPAKAPALTRRVASDEEGEQESRYAEEDSKIEQESDEDDELRIGSSNNGRRQCANETRQTVPRPKPTKSVVRSMKPAPTLHKSAAQDSPSKPARAKSTRTTTAKPAPSKTPRKRVAQPEPEEAEEEWDEDDGEEEEEELRSKPPTRKKSSTKLKGLGADIAGAYDSIRGEEERTVASNPKKRIAPGMSGEQPVKKKR